MFVSLMDSHSSVLPLKAAKRTFYNHVDDPDNFQGEFSLLTSRVIPNRDSVSFCSGPWLHWRSCPVEEFCPLSPREIYPIITGGQPAYRFQGRELSETTHPEFRLL